MDSIEKTGLQESTVIHDHQLNTFKYETCAKKSDSFVVDLESLSNGLDKEHTNNSCSTTTTTTGSTNSRITLQRSLSRKLPQRGTERKTNDRDPFAPCSSPRASQLVSTPEKPLSSSTLQMGSPDHSINNQIPQHQITIKTGGVNPIADGRWGKRPSFKRSPHSWFSDPKRILLFFATVSSMGTILLIYFTLSMSKPNENEGTLDWQ